MTHTKGPWVYYQDNHGVEPKTKPHTYFHIKPKEFPDDMDNHLEITGWVSEANARLIAAAPELLEALEAVKNFWDDETQMVAPYSEVMAAIAKARGEA